MNIHEAIVAIMKESQAVSKDQKNTQQNFKFRGIDAVMNAYHPVLAKYGVYTVPTVLEHYREERSTKNGGNLIYSILKVRYTFYAEDGSSVAAEVIGEGMDSADKSSNKAMAAAMKYALFQTFCIPTEEMLDPDAESPDESTPKGKPAEKPKEEPKAPVCEYCGKGKPIGKYHGKLVCQECYDRAIADANS